MATFTHYKNIFAVSFKGSFIDTVTKPFELLKMNDLDSKHMFKFVDSYLVIFFILNDSSE